MDGKRLVEEILIPAEHGAAYHVKKGQTQRVIMVDGPQVGDWTCFNAHNLKEHLDPANSYIINSLQGTGDDRTIRDLYSRPPHINVMFTITADTVGTHYVTCGARCTLKVLKILGAKDNHRNCFDNLAEAIAPYGLTPEDVPDVFNVFMNAGSDEHGQFSIRPPVVGKGGYIDMLANMDCLVALSACPGGDVTIVNGEGPDQGNRPLKVEIWE